MSEFEMMVLICSTMAGPFLWLMWYVAIGSAQSSKIRALYAPASQGMWSILYLLPLACTGIIWFVLTRFAASDVRGDGMYLLLYLVLGLVWVAGGDYLFRAMGINIVHDVIDRRNPAAVPAVAGALIGLTLCYCGGNIGEGPGTEVVFIAAGLATIVFFVAWWAFTLLTEVDYAVTIDRDLASGLRAGGFLIAAGLILGRAAAGNWVSFDATLMDLVVYGSPVWVLLIAAVVIEMAARPTPDRPTMPAVAFGWFPALFYVGGAVAYLMLGKFPV